MRQRQRHRGGGCTGGGAGGTITHNNNYTHTPSHTTTYNTNSSKLKNGSCARRLTTASTTTTAGITTNVAGTPVTTNGPTSARYQRRQSSIVTTNTTMTTSTTAPSGHKYTPAGRNSVGAATDERVELMMSQPRLSINSTTAANSSPPLVDDMKRTSDEVTTHDETNFGENGDSGRLFKLPRRFNSLSSGSTASSSKRSDIINLKT